MKNSDELCAAVVAFRAPQELVDTLDAVAAAEGLAP